MVVANESPLFMQDNWIKVRDNKTLYCALSA